MELDAAPGPTLQGMPQLECPNLRVLRASAEELAEHQRLLVDIGQESKTGCLWSSLEA